MASRAYQLALGSFLVGLVVILCYKLFLFKQITMHDNDVVLFVDRSDADLETAFVFYQECVFVQVAEFPGYGNRKWYLIRTIPAEIKEQQSKWADHNGDVKPPFLPGGLWYSKTLIFEGNQNADIVWFSNNNQDFERFVSDLKHAFVKKNKIVDELPLWVQKSKTLKDLLGM